MITSNRIWSKGRLSFWSWNDMITSEGAVKQLREMKSKGLDGVFIHSRGGLMIEYMGSEWMNSIGAVVKAAKEFDMEIWLYDEDGWPSGFCGGKVNGAGEKFQLKWLSYETGLQKNIHPSGHTIACYVKGDNGWHLVHGVEGVAETEQVLHVFFEVNPYYSDLLNPEAMDYFIRMTHEKYKEYFGHEFGKTIKGIFTDEPQYAGGRLPWSPYLAEYFQARFGYSILDILPDLLVNININPKANHDYWAAVSGCMVNSFTRKIGEWCEENGLCLTGHFACEDTLRMQMAANGGVMPHYEWMHMPAVDHVGRRIARPVFLKQIASVADQLGKKQILSEMYGASGWVMTFADFKHIADWQFTLGINVQCQHLAAYSLRGVRKRDYPPAISPQEPWWEDVTILNTYVETVLKHITAGRPVAEILIIHPLTSAWCTYRPEDCDSVLEMDRRLGEITDLLLNMQRDFNYCDEQLLEKYGKVEGNLITIGSMSYKLVILPSLYSIEKNTFQVLKEFVANGGKVVSFGRLPEWIAGEASAELVAWCASKVQHAMPTRKTVEAFLEGLLPNLKVIDAWGRQVDCIQSITRDLQGGKIHFLMNMYMHPVSVTIQLLGLFDIKRINVMDGSESPVKCQYNTEMMWFPVEFAPQETMLYVVKPADTQILKSKYTECSAYQSDKTTRVSMELAGQWEMPGDFMNTFTIDYCSFRLQEEEAWRGPKPVIQVQQEVLRMRKNVNVELQFTFCLENSYPVGKKLLLVVENICEHQVFVNGVKLNNRGHSNWFDPTLNMVEIGDLVKHGVNTISLIRLFEGDFIHPWLDEPDVLETERNRFHSKTEMENIYLIGSFSVLLPGMPAIPYKNSIRTTQGEFVLCGMNNYVEPSELTTQGLPFFAGTVPVYKHFDYDGTGKRVEIEFFKPTAYVITVEINGRLAGKLAWEPYKLDITDYLVKGDNSITIYLTSGFRNLLGPHHYFKGDAVFCGPDTFEGRVDWGDKADSYVLPETSWVDSYNFIPFGTGSNPIIHIYR